MEGPDFEKSPLLPAIAQDARTGDVLMLAYMNADAWAETLRTRRVCYFSRSRQQLWRKGETSGHVQHLKQVFYDCDADTILLKVEQVGGAACHEGYASCFFREVDPDTAAPTIIAERVFDPDEVYGSGQPPAKKSPQPGSPRGLPLEDKSPQPGSPRGSPLEKKSPS